jgi:hypothetical protein
MVPLPKKQSKKTYEGVEAKLYAFLTLTIYGGECYIPGSGRSSPGIHGREAMWSQKRSRSLEEKRNAIAYGKKKVKLSL